MIKKTQLVHVETQVEATERLEQEDRQFEIGQWYWVKEKEKRWFGCVVLIGTNFVELRSTGSRSHSTIRVHFDEVDDYLTFEPDSDGVLKARVGRYQEKVQTLMGKVKAITARLGMQPRMGLPQPKAEVHTTALATLSAEDNVEDYKTALVRAKEEELPELFKQIKVANERLASWMQAETIPLLAMAESMQGTIEDIDGRIFNVSLYAGLTESVERVRDGEPAAADEKLRLMQRRLYMDEECLLDYRHGGMEFRDIGKFDEWISETKNLERILPFPRCMVSMQVRRGDKDRSESQLNMFVKFDLKEADKATFIYIRNGAQLYRMGCDLEFGEMLFPDKGEFDPSEAMMVKMSGGRVDRMITERSFDSQKAAQEAQEKAREDWFIENSLEVWEAANQDELKVDDQKYGRGTDEYPGPKRVKWLWQNANPHDRVYWDNFRADDWTPFDQTSVYFDEAMKKVSDQMKHYNRIALIIQGLYDRSPVLHPHPPVKTWTAAGFEEAVELIYDGSMVLYAGPAPCYETYRESLMVSMDAASVFIGQEALWFERERDAEDVRRENSVDDRWNQDPTAAWWTPSGDDGPGFAATCTRFTKASRKVSFHWMRDARNRYGGDQVGATIKVNAGDLFNVSAYKPGDFVRFFEDPRTRAKYLQWAPTLLTAEEFHAGNVDVQHSVKK